MWLSRVSGEQMEEAQRLLACIGSKGCRGRATSTGAAGRLSSYRVHHPPQVGMISPYRGAGTATDTAAAESTPRYQAEALRDGRSHRTVGDAEFRQDVRYVHSSGVLADK